MSNDAVVIVSAARTPLCSLQGALASVPATDLGAIATEAVVDQAGLKNDEVVILLLPVGWRA